MEVDVAPARGLLVPHASLDAPHEHQRPIALVHPLVEARVRDHRNVTHHSHPRVEDRGVVVRAIEGEVLAIETMEVVSLDDLTKRLRLDTGERWIAQRRITVEVAAPEALEQFA